MRKRIIFHIGLPKTGSSALQALLSRNVAALERIGISYPNPENPQSQVCSGNLMHVMLNMATADRVTYKKPELLRAYLVQVANAAIDASPCQTVLLSGEFFSNWISSEVVDKHGISYRVRLTVDGTRLTKSFTSLRAGQVWRDRMSILLNQLDQEED